MKLGMQVAIGPGHIVLDGDPAPPPLKGAQPPIFGPYLLWPTGWMDKDATWYGGRPRPRRLCVRWGPSTPPQKGHTPNFWPMPNGYMYQDTTWYGGRHQPRRRRHCVRWGPSSPPLKGHPQFSTNVCCGQTAGWTKMQLGMEVGIGPGDFVVDGDPVPPEKRHNPTQFFSPCLLCPNGWMDQDATWYGGKPQPRQRWVSWGRSSP